MADELAVEADAVVVAQEEFGYTLYLVEEGDANVVCDGEQIATLTSGDVFGELGLLVTGRRTASVVAFTPMRMLAFFDSDFRRLERELPEVARRVRAQMAQRTLRPSGRAPPLRPKPCLPRHRRQRVRGRARKPAQATRRPVGTGRGICSPAGPGSRRRGSACRRASRVPVANEPRTRPAHRACRRRGAAAALSRTPPDAPPESQTKRSPHATPGESRTDHRRPGRRAERLSPEIRHDGARRRSSRAQPRGRAPRRHACHRGRASRRQR